MKMHFCTTDIAALISDINHTFDYAANYKHISMPLSNNLSNNMVAIDSNYFDKVIYNVYSNAIKYTPDGGTISTTIAEADDKIVIEIADSGQGIAPDKLELIFNRFYQVDTQQTAAYTGTGIGLHLSRSIVALHNGTITARNKENETGAIWK